MPRRSRNQITKELALKILSKLKAEAITIRSDVHDVYGVFHNDQMVKSFGVRRSSQKNKGHDHIPTELGVGPNFAKQLAQCPKSRDDFLRRIGELPEEDAGELPEEGADEVDPGNG